MRVGEHNRAPRRNLRSSRPHRCVQLLGFPLALTRIRRLAMSPKVGFIGLGIMGSRMAANLQARGHKLIVVNRTRDKAELLLQGCATWAASPIRMAYEVDILITMLATPEVIETTALCRAAVLRALRPVSIWITS